MLDRGAGAPSPVDSRPPAVVDRGSRLAPGRRLGPRPAPAGGPSAGPPASATALAPSSGAASARSATRRAPSAGQLVDEPRRAARRVAACRRAPTCTRRTVSGVSRFSAGTSCSSDSAAIAARASVEPPRPRPGPLGPGPRRGRAVGARGARSAARPRASRAAGAQRRQPPVGVALRRRGRGSRGSPAASPRGGRHRHGGGHDRGVAAMIRPGVTSRSRAISSRASHSSRTAPSSRRPRTLCSPDVRRHGSTADERA